MINLNGSRLTDILPEELASQKEVQALAHAVGRQVAKLCKYADNARTYAAIATLPENVLDYLAVELRTPAYEESYPIETKRGLIQDTLLFYAQMGTPAAVNRIVKTIFGVGEIEEWFEYGGQPHHFRVKSANIDAISENYAVFLRVLESVKRKSAWLDSITATITRNSYAYVGAAVRIGKQKTLQTNQVETTSFTILVDENRAILVDEGGNINLNE